MTKPSMASSAIPSFSEVDKADARNGLGAVLSWPKNVAQKLILTISNSDDSLNSARENSLFSQCCYLLRPWAGKPLLIAQS